MPPKQLSKGAKREQSVPQAQKSQRESHSKERLQKAKNPKQTRPERNQQGQHSLRAPELTETGLVHAVESTTVNTRYNLRSTTRRLSENKKKSVEPRAAASPPQESSPPGENLGIGRARAVSTQYNSDVVDFCSVDTRLQSLSIPHWVDLVNNESPQSDVIGRTPSTTPYKSLVYRNHGYDLTDEEMTSTGVATSATASQITVPDTEGKPKKKGYVDARKPQFYLALLDRNIDFNRQDDEYMDTINSIIDHPRDPAPTEEEERNWEADLEKCASSDESVFQRTIMMDLLDRHKLEGPLDYSCESTWLCERMPQKRAIGAPELARPRPDLAVSIKSSAIISPFAFSDLGKLEGVMCPESLKEEKTHRAFPFFAVEVKGSQGEVGNSIAIRQNFNTASQALHNMYIFMKIAGKEDIFFSDVRFFSAIATSAVFQLRVHRAIKLQKNRIKPDYPLGFRFDEVFRTSGERYSKAKISKIVKNVLFEYGVKVLLPILKESVSLVLEKFEETPLNSPDSQSRKRPAQESFADSTTSSQRPRVDNLTLA